MGRKTKFLVQQIKKSQKTNNKRWRRKALFSLSRRPDVKEINWPNNRLHYLHVVPALTGRAPSESLRLIAARNFCLWRVSSKLETVFSCERGTWAVCELKVRAAGLPAEWLMAATWWSMDRPCSRNLYPRVKLTFMQDDSNAVFKSEMDDWWLNNIWYNSDQI